MNESCDALFLSPHPDDAEIFCGGTAASWAAEGRKVRLADLSRGELATNGSVSGRREESLAAAQALGVEDERPVLGLPDGGLRATDPEQLRAIVALVRRCRPEVLVAPWREDRHPDHVAASELARCAFFFAGVSKFEPEAGQAHRPRHLLYYPCHQEVEVSLVIDVSGSIDAWRASVQCYRSQFVFEETSTKTPINRPGFLSGLLARRQRWGERVGVEWGEGFCIDGPWGIGSGQGLFHDGRGVDS